MTDGGHISMDIQQLEYFVAIVKENNVTRAAELMGISQPAMSKSIARLESEIGYKLFSRSGRKNELNEYGRVFYEWADNTIRAKDITLDRIKKINDNDTRRITIASSGFNLTGKLINGFQKEYPDVYIKELRFSKDRFPAILYEPEVSYVIATERYSGEKVHELLLAHGQLYLAVPLKHRFAHCDELPIAAAKEDSFILPAENSLFHEKLLNIFDQAGFTPKIAAEVESPHILSMVSASVGVAICSDSAFEMAEAAGCRLIPLSDEYCIRDTYLLWTEREKTTADISFLEYARRQQ